MPYSRAPHYGFFNLSQYRYVQQKYSKKTRTRVFWATTGLLLLFIGSGVAVQWSETDAQRKARAESLRNDYLREGCKLGKRACDAAQREIEMYKQNCKYLGEDCAATPQK